MMLSEFSRPFYVSELKSKAKTKKISADENERKVLAKYFNVVAVEEFSAILKIIPLNNQIQINGQVKAKIVQNCVITLEEIKNEIVQEVNVLFDSQAPRSANHNFSLEEEDPPEKIANGIIDLGAVASEQILLAIDPYPRKEGVIFNFDEQTQKDALQKSISNSPFEILAELIPKKD